MQLDGRQEIDQLMQVTQGERQSCQAVHRVCTRCDDARACRLQTNAPQVHVAWISNQCRAASSFCSAWQGVQCTNADSLETEALLCTLSRP